MSRARIAVAVTGLLVSCGFPAQDSPSPIDEAQQVETEITDPTGGSKVDAITTWFVNEGLVVPLVRRVASPVSVASAVNTVAVGVSEAEASRGLRSAIPDSAMVRDASLSRCSVSARRASDPRAPARSCV